MENIQTAPKAKIYYYDIGDYLSREDKLKIISDFHDISKLPFVQITPNEHGDWISQRNDKFSTWIPIEADKKFNTKSQSFFVIHSLGLTTNRDVYVYNYSHTKLIKQVKIMITTFNAQEANLEPKVDLNKISWSRGLRKSLERNKT